MSYAGPNFPLIGAQLSQESQSFDPASPYSSRMRPFPLIRETTHLTSMRRSDLLLPIFLQWRPPPRAAHWSPKLRNPVIHRKLGWGRASLACSTRSTSRGSFQLPQSLSTGRAEILYTQLEHSDWAPPARPSDAVSIHVSLSLALHTTVDLLPIILMQL